MTILYEPRAMIGGRWLDASDSRRFEVINPSDSEKIDDVADCGASGKR